MIGAPLRIGSRGSTLARRQAAIAMRALSGVPDLPRLELVEVQTRGDEVSAAQPRGGWEETDGQFTAELERALLAGRVDLAVHSLKDLPTEPRSGLAVAAVLERGDPRDCLMSRFADGVAGLPAGARVGTSSARRGAQLRAVRDDLAIEPIRGNVETRLARLRSGEYDAVVVAAAGLERLGVPPGEGDRLAFELMLPAPGQGALALQVREADRALAIQLATLDHQATRRAVDLERELLRAIGGGCLAPLGAFAEVAGGELRLRAAFLRPDGDLARVDLRHRDGATLVAAVATALLSAEVPM